MTAHITCPDCLKDIPVENPRICGKGTPEEKETALTQFAIAIHKKSDKCPGELHKHPELIETCFTGGTEPDPTCASCGFGRWRHTPEFNCKRFVARG